MNRSEQSKVALLLCKIIPGTTQRSYLQHACLTSLTTVGAIFVLQATSEEWRQQKDC